jgi:hypothetical protein
MSQADDSHTTIASDLPARPAKPRAKRIAPAKQRKLLENAIERLVELLDEIDPDADLEPNGDNEPWLGWPIPQEKLGQRLNTGASSSGDAGDDREHDTADNEPDLGWTEKEARTGKYDLWKQGEDEHDGSEPFLGWKNEGSQERLHSSPGDREWDCEDEGAEHDGAEPWGMGIPGGGSGGSGI